MSDASLTSAAAASQGEYQVVARRYRPQTFGELIGQEHVAQALAGAISSNRVGHAYLFTGARGVGKTSTARILAKALNCEQGPTLTPCNRCDACEAISAGDDVDVLEIDGASNRGIDEIRELRHNVNVRPSRSRFKIYIIDEVHMLTTPAFNALLKTLEEPPEHVKFIFCTTEAEKIPITILSRCQRFDFAGIQTTSIAERLKQIVAAEGVTAEPEALEILARRAAGSMRDSQSLLEQLLACGDTTISVADINRLLGTAASGRLDEIAGHLVDRNAAGALAALDTALAEGVEVGQLLEQLLGYFRDCLVAAVGCSAEAFLYTSSDHQQAVVDASRRLGVETLLAVMQIIDQALARMRYSTYGRTLAELALVRITQLEDLDQLPALIQQLRDGLPPATTVRTPQRIANPPPSPPEPEPAKKKAAEVADASAPIEPQVSIPAAVGHGLTAENLPAIWQQALASIGDITSDNAAMGSRVAISAPNLLAIGFPEKYTSCKLFCERPEHTEKLQRALQAVTGEPVRIQFELLPDPPSNAATAPPVPKAAPSARERLFEKSQHPLVRRAVELFQAVPLRVEGGE